MTAEGEHTEAWRSLESALADAELADPSPGFADRVMARISGVARGEPATWAGLAEALRRRGIPATVVWPLWLSATAFAVTIRETWQAWAEVWLAIRESMFATHATAGDNGAEG